MSSRIGFWAVASQGSPAQMVAERPEMTSWTVWALRGSEGFPRDLVQFLFGFVMVLGKDCVTLRRWEVQGLLDSLKKTLRVELGDCPPSCFARTPLKPP